MRGCCHRSHIGRRFPQLTEAVVDGATDDVIEGVAVSVVLALEATLDDVRDADGFLIGTSANFG